MKSPFNKCRQALLLGTIVSASILGAFTPALAQAGIGKDYNARDPRPCSKTASPTDRPTVAEAVASVICNGEHVAGIETLYLYEDVVVTQVASKGTPYVPTRMSATDIDVDFAIFPIRGSFKKYQCSLSSAKSPEKSCNVTHHADAEGRCFKNVYGQWRCSMSDPTVTDWTKAFPPGGVTAANITAAARKPVETRNDNQAAKTKEAPDAAGKDENGFPEPDFTEMEKYFEIVRTDYDFSLGRFNMLVKATKKTNVFQWYMTFYDADGVKVKESSFLASMGEPELGAPTRIYAYTPTEKEMKDVAKITVTRRPN